MPFQNLVYVQPSEAVAGDFASANPHATVDAGPGALVAAAAGATVGAFGWWDVNQRTVSNTGTGLPTGLVGRLSNVAAIGTLLAESSMVIPSGMPLTLYTAGDFWVTNSGGAANTVGQKAFANLTTGAVTFAAAGATVAGSVETKWVAQNVGAAGTVVKISSYPLG